MRPNVPILSVLRPGTERRFRAKLKRVGEHLEFMGSRTPRGYGMVDVMIAGVRYPILAHRLAWALANGIDPPADEMVLHARECSNPPCCEIKHLYLGNAQENHDDSVAVGTAFDVGSVVRGLRGVEHPAARYSQSDRRRALWIHYARGLSLSDAAEVVGCGRDALVRWRNEHEIAVAAGLAKAVAHDEFDEDVPSARRLRMRRGTMWNASRAEEQPNA